MKKKFQVLSELSQVHKASGEVLSFLKPLELSEAQVFDIRLCVEEALVNAIKYGNRQRKELPVDVEAEYDDDQIRIRVQDQGSGFQPGVLPDCTEGENKSRGHGRGVYLMHQLMDEVRYNKTGNSLLMVKSLKKKATPSSKGGV